MKRSSVVILSIIGTLLTTICLILVATSRAVHQDDWKKRTTPLPKETRDLLCSRFGLPLDDALCNGNKDVYALDFANIMRETFRPYEALETESSKAATYYDVEKIIGVYKYECEPVTHQADGLSYFVCVYDLRGDREFITAIFYNYPETAVMRLSFTKKFDD